MDKIPEFEGDIWDFALFVCSVVGFGAILFGFVVLTVLTKGAIIWVPAIVLLTLFLANKFKAESKVEDDTKNHTVSDREAHNEMVKKEHRITSENEKYIRRVWLLLDEVCFKGVPNGLVTYHADWVNDTIGEGVWKRANGDVYRLEAQLDMWLPEALYDALGDFRMNQGSWYHPTLLDPSEDSLDDKEWLRLRGLKRGSDA